MKLADLIPLIDSMEKIELEQNVKVSGTEPQWETVFSGYAMDMPWHFLRYDILPLEESETGIEPIGSYLKNGESVLSITIDNVEHSMVVLK